MIRRDLSPAEVRVLACLIEKARTTPDQYPLTRNAARLACNQATNRDPVLDLDEATVRAALERLGRNGLVRFTSTRGSRAAKYRHLAGDALGVGEADLAVLALLMLRGPQTPGELRARAGRLHHFTGMSEVEEALSRLIEKGLAVRFERRPGQKEQRFAHLLSDQRDEDRRDPPGQRDRDSAQPPAKGLAPSAAPVSAPGSAGEASPEAGVPPGAADTLSTAASGRDAEQPALRDSPGTSSPPRLEERVGALEAELRALREQLADLLED